MAVETLRIALISEVFCEADGEERLAKRLGEARDLGVELAVLPELPLNPWSPATELARDEDAELPNGPRHRRLSAAAKKGGIGVLGGAIVRDPRTGIRHNTALVLDAQGSLVATYRKVHLPEEPGFWETSHYQPGDRPPEPIREFGLPFGVQICSDINRPTGSSILSAMGAAAIFCPRATEEITYERWRLVFRANALTSGCYILSVNRPGPEQGVALGGPSLAIDPNGEFLAETSEPLCVVELSTATVAEARRRYPGYLKQPADLYARGWRAAEETTGPGGTSG
jgi:N-carbamoylputrescine amidase